ncbi:MAG: hypothetical protein IANPNBLG_03079 [Bryobacteraceae bacterium]|nr:hypothetical protein [Bryobacteraceae bacterium]
MAGFITRRGLLGGVPLGFAAGQAGNPLRAGAVAVNITPSLGCDIAGSMTNHVARDVHDELHARALVLDNGKARLAFVVCDLCVVAPEVIGNAKALIERHTGIPPRAVLVSATHTHSAPAAARLFQSEPDPRYMELLAARISDAVRRALRRMQPARIGWGTGTENRLVFNRRYEMAPGAVPANPFGATDRVLTNPGTGNAKVLRPAGATDPQVCLLAVQTVDGRPLCALGSYALHYVGGVPGDTISADYFAVWAGEMRQRLGGGPEFTAILANACSGNINNIDVRGSSKQYPPFAKMREVAAMLAGESHRVWQSISFHDWVELESVMEEVSLGVRRPGAAEVEEARRLLPADSRSVTERRQIYAKETLALAGYPNQVTAPVQAIRIGELGIATFPGEAFVEMGIEVKQKSPFKPTFLIELANSYLGYIPTVSGHRDGGYETWRAKSSFLEVEAAPKLVAAALSGLQKLRVQRRPAPDGG